MIKNERQYRITKNAAAKFRKAIERANGEPAATKPNDKILRKASVDAMRSQLEELEEQLRLYETLQTARGRRTLTASIEHLAALLIQGRIAREWSQRELAEKLGLKMQQIQQYEASDYASASLTRILEVCQALGMTAKISAKLVELPSLEEFSARVPVGATKRKGTQ